MHPHRRGETYDVRPQERTRDTILSAIATIYAAFLLVAGVAAGIPHKEAHPFQQEPMDDTGMAMMRYGRVQTFADCYGRFRSGAEGR